MAYKKKYNYGTSSVNIETPREALAQNEIDIVKAQEDSMSNPLIQTMKLMGELGLQATAGQVPGGEYINMANQFTKLLAYGGQIGSADVEVEGKEVVQTPDGNVSEFKGPSHEQGGIDVNLPEGSKVYSDRIRIKGKTLADRKKNRDNIENKFDKLIGKTFDPLAEKSRKRTEANNEIEEKYDLDVQKLANQMMDGNKQKLAYGTPDPIRGILDEEINPLTTLQPLDFLYPNFNNNPTSISVGNKTYGTNINPQRQVDAYDKDRRADSNIQSLDNPYLNRGPKELSKPGEMSSPLSDYFNKFTDSVGDNRDKLTNSIKDGLTKIKDFDKEGFKENVKGASDKLKENNPNYTTGDLLGMSASLYQSIAPLMNTYKERATDEVNPNYFKDYGKESLKEYDNMEGTMSSLFESQIERLAQSKRTQQANNSLGARGINQKRALNLAGEQQFQDSYNQAIGSFNERLLGLMQGKANLKENIDSKVMAGEREADIADRMDKANFYTERGKDIVGLTEGLQSIAGNMNEATYRDSMINMINELNNKYGIQIDMKGGLAQKKKEDKKLKEEKKSVSFEDLLISGDDYTITG